MGLHGFCIPAVGIFASRHNFRSCCCPQLLREQLQAAFSQVACFTLTSLIHPNEETGAGDSDKGPSREQFSMKALCRGECMAMKTLHEKPCWALKVHVTAGMIIERQDARMKCSYAALYDQDTDGLTVLYSLLSVTRRSRIALKKGASAHFGLR